MIKTFTKKLINLSLTSFFFTFILSSCSNLYYYRKLDNNFRLKYGTYYGYNISDLSDKSVYLLQVNNTDKETHSKYFVKENNGKQEIYNTLTFDKVEQNYVTIDLVRIENNTITNKYDFINLKEKVINYDDHIYKHSNFQFFVSDNNFSFTIYDENRFDCINIHIDENNSSLKSLSFSSVYVTYEEYFNRISYNQ